MKYLQRRARGKPSRSLYKAAENNAGLDPKAFEALLSTIFVTFRERFLALVEELKNKVDLTSLTNLLEAGDFSQALLTAEELATGIASQWGKAYVLAGEETVDALGDQLKVIVDFNPVNDSAVRAIQEARLRLIQEITEGQRNTIRQVITDGIERGLNPKQIAIEIQQHIGLTQNQVAAVNNYRRLLEQGSADALQRALRDKRFDPSIQRALDSDLALTPAQIAKMVERYRERYLSYRATTISRTESLRAAHAGALEAFQQQIDLGNIDPDELQRKWHVRIDGRERPHHHSMKNQLRGWNERFTSGLGNRLLLPGDVSAPPEEVCDCRCVVTYLLKPST